MQNLAKNNFNIVSRLNKIRQRKYNIFFDFNNSFHWQIDNNITLTVGLPIYNARYNITWLALKSLQNQIDIDFKWELVIMEEYSISKEIIKEFIYKLHNCVNIVYVII